MRASVSDVLQGVVIRLGCAWLGNLGVGWVLEGFVLRRFVRASALLGTIEVVGLLARGGFEG